jgi:Uma2 family endonuclease
VAVEEKLYTADDLWELSPASSDDDSTWYELDEGELVEISPGGDKHGLVGAWLLHLIISFVVANDLGEVTTAETGFVLRTDPETGRDTVRAPDVGFIAKARLKPLTGRFYRLAPDFAAEVVPPTDRARDIRRKVNQYLRNGTLLVWVVYPDEKFVDVYQPAKDTHTAKIDDTLDGGDVFPSFKLPVKDVFARLRD